MPPALSPYLRRKVLSMGTSKRRPIQALTALHLMLKRPWQHNIASVPGGTLKHRTATTCPSVAVKSGDEEMQLSCQHISSQSLGRRRLTLQQLFGVLTIAARSPSARSGSVPALASCLRRPLVTGALIVCATYAASRAGDDGHVDNRVTFPALAKAHSRRAPVSLCCILLTC